MKNRFFVLLGLATILAFNLFFDVRNSNIILQQNELQSAILNNTEAPKQKAVRMLCCLEGSYETDNYGSRCVTGTDACVPNACAEGTFECGSK